MHLDPIVMASVMLKSVDMAGFMWSNHRHAQDQNLTMPVRYYAFQFHYLTRLSGSIRRLGCIRNTTVPVRFSNQQTSACRARPTTALSGGGARERSRGIRLRDMLTPACLVFASQGKTIAFRWTCIVHECAFSQTRILSHSSSRSKRTFTHSLTCTSTSNSTSACPLASAARAITSIDCTTRGIASFINTPTHT